MSLLDRAIFLEGKVQRLEKRLKTPVEKYKLLQHSHRSDLIAAMEKLSKKGWKMGAFGYATKPDVWMGDPSQFGWFALMTQE